MRVVRPVQIDESNLISTNVPLGDAPEWTPNTVYALGDQRVYGLVLYEALVAGDGGTTPPGQQTAATPRWFAIGPVNRWRMFNKRIGNRWLTGLSTSNPDEIDITIRPGIIVNSIGLVGVSAREVEISVTVPGQGQVYGATYSLVTRGAVRNWYQHWFSEFARRTTVVDFNLPAYRNGDIRIVVRNPGATAKVGTFVVGAMRQIGVTVYGSGVDFNSFSRVTEDDFGNVEIVSRGSRRTNQFDVDVERTATDAAVEFLDSIRDEPTLYVGSEAMDSTVVVGWLRKSPFVFANYAISKLNIEVWRL